MEEGTAALGLCGFVVLAVCVERSVHTAFSMTELLVLATAIITAFNLQVPIVEFVDNVNSWGQDRRSHGF